MISLVLALLLQAGTPAAAVAPLAGASWTPDARCAAALSVQAEKPSKAKSASLNEHAAGSERPLAGAPDPLPVEALIKMNRAAGVARAEGLERGVVERGVATFKAEYRRFDADHPVEFQSVVRNCRLARGPDGPAQS